MPTVHANKEFDELLTAAFQQSAPAYIEAVAATIEGSPSEAWRDFEVVTARAILLSYLVGIAQTFEEAEIAADQFEPDKVAYAKSDCGANAEGGGGFQPGNTCSGDGDGKSEVGESSHATSTPEFKAWFGDSKIVDDDGEPLVVYHGTDSDVAFDEFTSDSTYGISTALGPHFAADKSVSETFTETRQGEGKEGGRVYPVYLKMENPLIVETGTPTFGISDDVAVARVVAKQSATPEFIKSVAKDNGFDMPLEQVEDVLQKWEGGESASIKFGSSVYNSLEELVDDRVYGSGVSVQIQQPLQKMVAKFKNESGYDGIIYENTSPEETKNAESRTSYILFNSTGVKSATGNTGAFDPDNPKITHARSDCGAGEDGSPGFKPGNTCAGDSDGQSESEESKPKKRVRYEAGSKLTKKQKEEVLKSINDVYLMNGIKKDELKGTNHDGDPIYGYPHLPELFYTSDITGAKIRRFIILPDGSIAHPSEVYGDQVKQSEILAALEMKQYTQQMAKLADEQRLRRVAVAEDSEGAVREAMGDANMLYNRAGYMLPYSYLAESPDGGFVRVNGVSMKDMEYFNDAGFVALTPPVEKPSELTRNQINNLRGYDRKGDLPDQVKQDWPEIFVESKFGESKSKNARSVFGQKNTFAKIDWPLDVGFDEFRVEPFEEAIRLFDERIPMLATNVPKLAQIAKAQAAEIAMAEKLGVVAKLDGQTNAISQALGTAFWVSDVDQPTTIALKDLISQAVRGVLPDERLSLPEFIDRAWLVGAQGLTASRLETVYRTNMQSAYNEGHMSTLRAPEVKKVAPLVMIVEMQDPRSRDHHAAMNGYIHTVEEFDRRQLSPPNGYNCRGTVRTVSWTEAERLGLVDNDQIDFDALKRYNGNRQGYIDRGEYPDPGFTKVYRAA